MVHILTLAAKEEFGFSTRFHSLCCRSPQKLVLKQPSMHSSLFSASGKSLEQKKNRQVVQWSTEGRSIQPKLQAQSLNTVVTPRGGMVKTSALYTKGQRFEPHRSRRFFTPTGVLLSFNKPETVLWTKAKILLLL